MSVFTVISAGASALTGTASTVTAQASQVKGIGSTLENIGAMFGGSTDASRRSEITAKATQLASMYEQGVDLYQFFMALQDFLKPGASGLGPYRMILPKLEPLQPFAKKFFQSRTTDQLRGILTTSNDFRLNRVSSTTAELYQYNAACADLELLVQPMKSYMWGFPRLKLDNQGLIAVDFSVFATNVTESVPVSSAGDSVAQQAKTSDNTLLAGFGWLILLLGLGTLIYKRLQ